MLNFTARLDVSRFLFEVGVEFSDEDDSFDVETSRFLFEVGVEFPDESFDVETSRFLFEVGMEFPDEDENFDVVETSSDIISPVTFDSLMFSMGVDTVSSNLEKLFSDTSNMSVDMSFMSKVTFDSLMFSMLNVSDSPCVSENP